jgi:ElaB/YqjD/DUF883 family membrane-anchored ribosome-binding protein
MASSDVTTAAAKAKSTAREAELELQISQLREDIKSITDTVGKLANSKTEEAKGKLSEVKDAATNEIEHLKAKGQDLIGEAQGQAEQYEKQLKDTIREKPLTSVATAVGVGFVLALLTR